LIVTVIELIYYLRTVGRIYFAKEEVEEPSHKPSVNAIVAMSFLALFIIVIGVYPNLITDYLHSAASSILDKANYIQQILAK
jgi:formate hydrogenlyase subunit 3/multisubunit Na+/H+ antiporter MnhD subunit